MNYFVIPARQFAVTTHCESDCCLPLALGSRARLVEVELQEIYSKILVSCQYAGGTVNTFTSQSASVHKHRGQRPLCTEINGKVR